MTDYRALWTARIATALTWIAVAANVVGTVVVLLLVLAVNTDVVARGVFSAPFRGTVEVVQFSMVLIVFLQLPDVVRVDRLTRRHPRIRIRAGDRLQRRTEFDIPGARPVQGTHHHPAPVTVLRDTRCDPIGQ